MNPRRATPDDLPLILSLMQEFYAEDQIVFEPERAQAALRELLSHPELGAILLLSDDAAPGSYGMITLILGFTLEHGGRFILLDELYLQPPLRGRGLGKAAMQLAERYAREQGAKAIRLEVHHHNLAAKALYTKAGFEDDHRDIMTRWLS